MDTGTIDYKLGQLTADMAEVKSDVKELKLIVNGLNLWKVKVSVITSVIGGTFGFIASKIYGYF